MGEEIRIDCGLKGLNPTDYQSLTQSGVLGLGVLFFGSATVILFYMYVGGLKEFASTLLKIATDQIISQNSQTLSNKDLGTAVQTLATQVRDAQDAIKELQRKS